MATKSGVVVITFAIGAASLAWTILRTPFTLRQHTREANYVNEQPGTLRHSIRKAKANGDNTAELSVLGCGWARYTHLARLDMAPVGVSEV